MILTKEQIAEFRDAAAPLMKFMAENFHPHTAVILDAARAEIVEGCAAINTNEFIKD